MHVHLPKPLHGWREFIGEVGIIVVGVLIALSAEQVIDTMHWREKVGHAESAMRLELAEDDGPQAYGRLIIAPCLDAQIVRIHDRAGQVPADQLRQWVAAYAPPFRVWDSAVWNVVLGSDVGSHMGPDRLVEWSSPYRLMPGLTDANAQERDVAVELHEALPASGEPSAAELQTLRRTAAHLGRLNYQFYRASQLILARSQALGAPVPEPMQREMLKQAHALYGQCIRPPNLNARPVAQSLGANLHWLPVRFGS